MKYAYLGPTGTFTESALQQIATAADELIPYVNVTATLDAVRNSECDRALVPIENSVEGVVARTLDELAIGQPLVITGEITLPVNFALMTLSDKDINAKKYCYTSTRGISVSNISCEKFSARRYFGNHIYCSRSGRFSCWKI